MSRLLHRYISLFTVFALLLNVVTVSYMVAADPSDELAVSAVNADNLDFSLVEVEDLHSFDLHGGHNHGCHAASHILGLLNSLPLLLTSQNNASTFIFHNQPVFQSWAERIFHPPRA